MTDSSKSFEIWYKKMILEAVIEWSINPNEDAKIMCELKLKRMEFMPDRYSNNDVQGLFEAWQAAQVDQSDTVAKLREQNLQLQAEISGLKRHLIRVIGDHIAPEHCYSTGPLTGDVIYDLISCPSCAALEFLSTQPTTIAEHDETAHQ
jgi:hypothetical protein